MESNPALDLHLDLDLDKLSDEQLARLWKERKDPNVTINGFSKLYGINTGNFSRWINGKRESRQSREAALRYLQTLSDVPAEARKEITIREKQCRFYLKGVCDDPHCPLEHDTRARDRDKVEEMLEVRKRVMSCPNLRVLVFLDGDSFASSVARAQRLIDSTCEPAAGRCHGVHMLCGFSPVMSEKLPLISNKNFHSFRSMQPTKDSVDIALSMEAARFDMLCRPEAVFVLASRDWFIVEASERLRLSGRTVHAFDVYKRSLILYLLEYFPDISWCFDHKGLQKMYQGLEPADRHEKYLANILSAEQEIK